MPSWSFGLMALGFGAAFCAVGVHRYRAGRTFLASAHRVAGVVAGIHRVERTDTYEFFPVLRFRTLDGAEIETVAQTRGGSFELTRLKGRQVAVFYDPRDPRTARMDTSSGRGTAGSVGMVVFGFFLVVLGVGLVFASLA
ncbi:hypothetical protein GCM10023088_11870 [Actinomadura verrucosospora]|uniref:DUF3592 domain-containing protein n=1 Tax=Actinomadura verrucosospora TaxID=46165 RepID=UPI0031EC5E85